MDTGQHDGALYLVESLTPNLFISKFLHRYSTKLTFWSESFSVLTSLKTSDD